MRYAAIFAFAATGLLAAPAAGHAQTITCEPASTPLLQVTAYSLTQGNLLPSQGWDASVLCKDGRMVSWSTGYGPDPAMPASPPPFPFTAELQVGRVTPDSLANLSDAMQAAAVGQLADCSTLILAAEATSLRVTWFGRGQRRHTFDIGALGNGVSCSDSAHALFVAILSLQFEPGAVTVQLP